MFNGVEYALEITTDIMLPVLDKVTDLEDCIENNCIIGIDINLHDDKNFGNKYGNNFYNEGLLIVKTDNYIDVMKKIIEKSQSEYAYYVKMNRIGYTQKDYEERCNRVGNVMIREIARRDKFVKDPKLHAKTLEELERRKTVNIKILRSYGLDL